MTKEEKIRYRVSKFDNETITETCCSICSGHSTDSNCDLKSQPLTKIFWSRVSRQFQLKKYPWRDRNYQEQQIILLYPSVNCQALAQAMSTLMENFHFQKA